MDRGEKIAAADGKKKVDILLIDGRIVNVFSAEIYLGNIAIYQDEVVGFGDYEADRIIDLKGQYVAPGFIDAHVHIESSMVTIPEYAKAVMPLGTTSVIIDPHEIANVLGLEGLRFMLDSAAFTPLGVYFMLSSCVPATQKETSGANISARDIELFIDQPWVLGLAEMMDYPGVIAQNPEIMKKLQIVDEEGKKIDGHAPQLTGKNLAAYIAAGIDSDHECATIDEAKEKLRMGMTIMIREGTAAKNLDALLPLVNHQNARRFLLCTDDRHCYDLLNQGHINYLVKRSVQKGIEPVQAIQMATINTAHHFHIPKLGAIAPGYQADLVVFDDFNNLTISLVMKKGKIIGEDIRVTSPTSLASEITIRSTINVNVFSLPDLKVSVPPGKKIRIIDIVPSQIITHQFIDEPKMFNDQVVSDIDRDLLKIAVFERHQGSDSCGIGFVRGFGIKKGAIASSVAHDSHNIIVTGTNDEDMIAAVKEVILLRGGLVVVVDGQVKARLSLPIGGLMTDEPLSKVVQKIEKLIDATHNMGGVLDDPFMQLSFLALPVVPEIKITDRGLFDVGKFDYVPLYVE